MTGDRETHEQMRARARERWSDLSDADLEDWQGDREGFVGKLQDRLGMATADAEAAADDLARTVEHKWGASGASQSGDEPDDLARTVGQNI